jgi:preprotein translocase subunit YajC
MHLLLSTMLLLAQSGDGSGSPAAPEGGPSFFNPIFLIPILFIFLWLFLLRPGQKRREREQRSMMDNLNKNDKVITNAGIVALVHSIQDDEIVLKLEDNAKMRILKTTIFRNVSAEERQKAGAAGSSTAAPKPEETAREQKA